MAEFVFSFGTNKGNPFPERTGFSSLAMRCGSFVDKIIIDNQGFGGDGGSPTTKLLIDSDDFVSMVIINHGAVVDYLHFATRKGLFIAGGGGGGTPSTVIRGRLLGISGMTGYFVPGPAAPLVICNIKLRFLDPQVG
ncbi:hypothetical protein [Rhizobium leguminosarum]|uniref:hypothetical protein n=1 Tax=Rhizobium leguminosarum TaxID=384 RepID=UPI003F96196F